MLLWRILPSTANDRQENGDRIAVCHGRFQPAAQLYIAADAQNAHRPPLEHILLSYCRKKSFPVSGVSTSFVVSPVTLRSDPNPLAVQGRVARTRSAFHKAFLGAWGIAEAGGLMDAPLFEVELKQATLPRCQEVIAVLDGRKFARPSLAGIKPLSGGRVRSRARQNGRAHLVASL